MSGSAVIARHSGYWSQSGDIDDSTVIGTILSFVGIYSGRTDDDELGVQIGLVWKRSVIDDIFSCK
jgi:hypothetical protein